MKLKMAACIDAPKEKVWQVLSDIAHINLWVEPIQSAYCEGDVTRGVGALRVCHLHGDMVVRERFVQWEENNAFTYEAEPTKLFKWAKNKWSIKTESGKTLVTTESEVILGFGILGKLLEPLMYLMSKKMGKDSLAALQYLVETGQPYEGKFSKLPRVSASC